MADAMLKTVQDLREYDHVFLSAEGVESFAKRFGVTITPYKAYENPNEIKGLTLEDGPGVLKDKKGRRYTYGMDAQVLAMHICDQLGVKYMEKFGRGSQLRECCDALQKHFGG